MLGDHLEFVVSYFSVISKLTGSGLVYDSRTSLLKFFLKPQLLPSARVYIVVRSAEGRLEPKIAPRSG